MITTFSALLCAHVVAELAVDLGGVVDEKIRSNWPACLWQGAARFIFALVFLAPITAVGWAAALALTLGHLSLDLITSQARKTRLDGFFADQIAHILLIAVVSVLTPDLWASGAWRDLTQVPAIMTIVSGWIIAAHTGGFALKILMQRWSETVAKDMPSLENGGRIIGVLERSLVFVFLLVGQTEAVGFLIAAKSVLRFGSVKQEAKLSEFVIIGTLASITWAILAGIGTLWLLSQLPALGIPNISP